MTTFTSSVSGSVSGPNGSKSWTVSDADYINCLNYLVAKYTPRNVVSGGAAPTQAQALVMWQQENITMLAGQAKQWLDQQQAQTINNPLPVFT